MGEAVGASSVDLEWVQVHPTGLVKPDDADAKIKFLAAEALRGVGGIVLDANGKRFANELGRRDYVTGEMWSYRSRMPPRNFELLLGSHPTKLKYCTTCSIYRPPRCTHCAICDDCVERFDHHCPWVGNCIGKRNYWLFYGFVTTTGVLTVFVLLTSIIHLSMVCDEIRENSEEDKGVGDAFLEG